MQAGNDDSKLELNYDGLVPLMKKRKPMPSSVQCLSNLVLVFSRHRHYRHLVVELVSAEHTKQGKLKKPLKIVDPLDLIWKTEDQQELKFFAAVSKFKNQYQ